MNFCHFKQIETYSLISFIQRYIKNYSFELIQVKNNSFFIQVHINTKLKLSQLESSSF